MNLEITAGNNNNLELKGTNSLVRKMETFNEIEKLAAVLEIQSSRLKI